MPPVVYSSPTGQRPASSAPYCTRALAFTRYCFTSKLNCRSHHFFIAPPPSPAKPTLLHYYRTTIAHPFCVQIPDGATSCLQCALLYTSSSGQRRIRVLLTSLPCYLLVSCSVYRSPMGRRLASNALCSTQAPLFTCRFGPLTLA